MGCSYLSEILHEDVKRLLAELLERAIRDLFILEPADYDFSTAYHLIFDDDYYIFFDGLLEDENREPLKRQELNLDDILQFIELEKEYIRCQIKKQLLTKRPKVAQLVFPECIEGFQDIPVGTSRDNL